REGAALGLGEPGAGGCGPPPWCSSVVGRSMPGGIGSWVSGQEPLGPVVEPRSGPAGRSFGSGISGCLSPRRRVADGAPWTAVRQPSGADETASGVAGAEDAELVAFG